MVIAKLAMNRNFRTASVSGFRFVRGFEFELVVMRRIYHREGRANPSESLICSYMPRIVRLLRLRYNGIAQKLRKNSAGGQLRRDHPENGV
jgi:hypothetical protein